MSKGFGAQPTRGTDLIIQNSQKNTKALRNDFQFKRNAFTEQWHSINKDNSYETPSLASLFSPYTGHSCMVSESPSKCSTVGHHNAKFLFFANTDFWYAFVKRENHHVAGCHSCSVMGRPIPKKKQNHYEFQIGVKVGPFSFFMPSLIKERICTWHGNEIYNSWRKMVKADLQNLKPYLSAFNPPKNLYSFACDASSEKVCESLGLPVKHGVAYWLRKEESELKSEVVAEVVQGTAVSGLNRQQCFNRVEISATTSLANYFKYAPGNFIDFAKVFQAA
jgi:hypothetical protein